MFFDKRYTEKPKDDVGFIVNSLSECNIELKELADKVSMGCTFIPALLRGGKSNNNFVSQELWALDFDHNSTIDEILSRCKSKGLEPVFGYTSFSHTPDNHRFRLVFHSNRLATDIEERNRIQRSIMNIFPECDPACYSASHFFYGGKQQLLYDEDKSFDPDVIIQKYYKPPESPPKSKYSDKSKNQTRSFNKDSLNHKAKIEAISKLNVNAMRKLLGFKDNIDFGLVEHSGGVLPPTNKKSSFLLVAEKPPNDDLSLENTVVKCKADLYDLFNQIDLYEYLGVGDKKICCCLPEHNDKNPSANVFISYKGQAIYRCYSCNKVRNIITITEELSGCKRHEAINFIKDVYGIKLEESDWAREQKEIMIDSANYLSSGEFAESFPEMAKLIKHRKHYLQKLLLYFTQYVNEDNQIDGSPFFYSSYNTLLKICDIPADNKKKLSQTLTLFALLDLIEKLPEEKIPTNELNKAKCIAAKYGLKKRVSFYRFDEYGINTLSNGEKKAKILKEKNFRIGGCTREMVLRTFGKEEADRIFPQFKYNNNLGTSTKSDKHTLDIVKAIEYYINQKGYATEKDVIKLLATDYPIDVTKHQLEISLQEILDTYSLKRVRLNKELKEKLSFESNGYPFVILRKEESEVNT